MDISEFAIYQLYEELKNYLYIHEFVLIPLIGSVQDINFIKKVFNRFEVDTIYHASAYKHVPLMEQNIMQCINNNVFATLNVAELSVAAKVKNFILVSTDKAVNPTNVMGASKRLAEMVCQGLQEKQGTKFVTVRFGNVLGSSGSVIPKFREQIAGGGPVTITHPEITRYFMSIPEAAQLVMQAGMMGAGGEIFVLDMGESVKIVDLAKDMIRLSGLSEDEIEIIFTGLRPGEKLYEELLADGEHTLPTPHEKLRVAEARTTDLAWVQKLLEWVNSIHDEDEQVIKAGLKTWVAEYNIDVTTNTHHHVLSKTTTIH